MFQYKDTHRMAQMAIRQFMDKEIRPHVIHHENHPEDPPYPLMKKLLTTFGVTSMAESAFQKMKKREAAKAAGEAGDDAEKKGGSMLGGNDPAMSSILGIELARVCPGIALSFGATLGLYGQSIMNKGTLWQKEKYGLPIFKMEKIGAWGMTEPGAGSDAYGSMRTTARRDGDWWVLNGHKTFITNAPFADYFVIYAKIDEGQGVSRDTPIQAFIVEKGTPGFEASKPFRKMGMHSSPTGEVFLDNVKIPLNQLLGEKAKEQAKEQSRDVFSSERTGTATMCLGIIDRCCELTFKYMREREQFGQKIGDFQGLRWMLADMLTIRENVKNWHLRMLDYQVRGERVPMEIACADKLYCAPAATKVAMDAVQIMGGFGYMQDAEVEMHARDAKLIEIGGGTNQIQQNTIAREVMRTGQIPPLYA
ncbi:MAG: acyl-CoA/acyl-ACP dehydrogenase [Deltaproteobacteria bacterium]|nr:acyl-CoA/acyl-ACP dehydrogenase [Deltaproteobacteria bacterium]